MRLAMLVAAVLLMAAPGAWAQAFRGPVYEGNFALDHFTFRSGETLARLNLHYRTLGAIHRDANGVADNVVLIMHGTGGDGRQFLRPYFADVLFAPGGLLDPASHFIVLPDAIGHGGSSKPSNGLRAKFPHYDYDDMVAADVQLLTKGLKVDHLRLAMGTSMGCMHAFVLGEAYPDFADALMPLACLPTELVGRNRIWRKLAIDAITHDPAYRGGSYTAEPKAGLRTAESLLLIAGGAPLRMQKVYPTRAAADAYADTYVANNLETVDANDLVYQLAASRNYNPSSGLSAIKAAVMWVNSADDFINPPELGLAEGFAARLKRGQFVLIPASAETRGHGTHTYASFWQDKLKALLDETARPG